MRGPAVFLAQLLRDEPPFDRLESIAEWVGQAGFVGVQIPTWDARAFDLDRAAASQAYCDEYRGKLAEAGLQVTELGAQVQGQLLALHPALEYPFQLFFPRGLSGSARAQWAAGELAKVIRAARRLGTTCIPALSGGFAWHLAYPWPPHPAGLIDEAFAELARLWRPLLDLAADAGLVFAFELHPGSDLFDGATFERFLEVTKHHPAARLNYDPSHLLLQQLDYVEFIQRYGDRIAGFHVKDAEFRPDGRMGVYGGYQPWKLRPGRFRSLGDGQVDFKRVFTALALAGFQGWAVLEWECCVKGPEQGITEGARFILDHLIEETTVAFDDFARGHADRARNRRILGLSLPEDDAPGYQAGAGDQSMSPASRTYSHPGSTAAEVGTADKMQPTASAATEQEIDRLKAKAREIRRLILTMVHGAQSGHVGGSLSATDLVVALYYHIMRHDPKCVGWPLRDRFVLSKGHCTPILYAVLADCGYFPLEELQTFRRVGSRLQGHPYQPYTPGVEASTGTLGLGLSTALGMALAARLGHDKHTYYVLCGDGEQQEGQIWEAAMFGAKYGLSNVIALTDRNRLQTDGNTEQVMPLEPLADKWRSFGWNVHEVDGHDFDQIIGAVAHARQVAGNRPSMIIAHTTKGKGVEFMENNVDWHGKVPNREEFERALEELR
jgi:transketolase N-terminal domain/subunit/sugar phosphate isomerase/epimerase